MKRNLFFELMKLRKRPATWVLGGMVIIGVLLFDYLLTYSAASATEQGRGTPGLQVANVQAFKEFLFPAAMPVNIVNFLCTFGPPIALILGALAVGSEYGWGTLKMALVHQPARFSFFLAKCSAVGLLLFAFSLLALAVGATVSFALAGFEGVDITWPPLVDVVGALGAAWLILAVWASLGAFLATLFRGTALAIGLGLLYALVLEPMVLGLPAQSEWLQDASRALLSKNSIDLANHLGDVPQAFAPPADQMVDLNQSILVLTAYTTGFMLLAALLFWRRDVEK